MPAAQRTMLADVIRVIHSDLFICNKSQRFASTKTEVTPVHR